MATLEMQADKRLLVNRQDRWFCHERNVDILTVQAARYYKETDLAQTEMRICFSLCGTGDYAILRFDVNGDVLLANYTVGGALTRQAGIYRVWLEFWKKDGNEPIFLLCSEMQELTVHPHESVQSMVGQRGMTYFEALESAHEAQVQTLEALTAQASALSQEAMESARRAIEAAQEISAQRIDLAQYYKKETSPLPLAEGIRLHSDTQGLSVCLSEGAQERVLASVDVNGTVKSAQKPLATVEYVERLSGKTPITHPIPDAQTGETQLFANSMNRLGKIEQGVLLTLQEGTEGFDNAWDFTLTQGRTAQPVTLPEVHWGMGIAPAFAANTTTVCRLYEVETPYVQEPVLDESQITPQTESGISGTYDESEGVYLLNGTATGTAYLNVSFRDLLTAGETYILRASIEGAPDVQCNVSVNTGGFDGMTYSVGEPFSYQGTEVAFVFLIVVPQGTVCDHVKVKVEILAYREPKNTLCGEWVEL